FVRRNLIAAGFAVERRKCFAGKREMLCGLKILGAEALPTNHRRS
ncbi:MnmC family methyltransferase, partial [Rhizobium leguminosarum]